jgi:adenylate cyclase
VDNVFAVVEPLATEKNLALKVELPNEFCDLRGFTAFSEISEPEEVMLVLREYHTALGVLVDKFEGTVERFVGDGLLVIFNDPLPCPDPSMRAVQMAGTGSAGLCPAAG